MASAEIGREIPTGQGMPEKKKKEKKNNSLFPFFPFSAPKPGSSTPLGASSGLGSRRWAPVNSPCKGSGAFDSEVIRRFL